MDCSPYQKDAIPSSAAERLHHSLSSLTDSNHRLSPTAYQHILHYCGIRPNLVGWRSFLRWFLTLLGLLSLVVGMVFFIAWNWAFMSKMSKFFLVQLFIIALTIVVWWRWYDVVARMALLAVGISFGGLFALYGQVYQTGADSWELFYAWSWVLLPLALLGRQNVLWFLAWVIANLAFQLYYISQTPSFFGDMASNFTSWLQDPVLYGYLIIQVALLLIREAFAEFAAKKNPSGWLASRWFSRVMAAYLLLTLTTLMIESIWAEHVSLFVPSLCLIVVIATGYLYYRYYRPDLCMLIFGVASLIAIGYALIIRLVAFGGISSLFISGLLMVLLLIAGCALLLHWRRQIVPPKREQQTLSDEAVLIQELHQHQLLTDAQMVILSQSDRADRLPWYLRSALAVACWVAGMISLCLLGLLLYVFGVLDESADISVIAVSLMLAVLAHVMLRKESIAQRHIGLTWAIVATGGLCIGVSLLVARFSSSHDLIGILWYLPVIGLLAAVMPNTLYRTMAVAAWVFLFIPTSAELFSRYFSEKLTFVLVMLCVAAIVGLWLGVAGQQSSLKRAYQHIAAALLYGIPIGLAAQSLTSMPSDIMGDLFWDYSNHSTSRMFASGIALGFIVSALVHAVMCRTATRRVYVPAAILCGALAIFSPGIGLGLAFLFAARYQGNNRLLVCAGGFLTWYLMDWYYFLDVTLLYKSLLLLASGLMLLSLAWAANQLLPATMGETHEN